MEARSLVGAFPYSCPHNPQGSPPKTIRLVFSCSHRQEMQNAAFSWRAFFTDILLSPWPPGAPQGKRIWESENSGKQSIWKSSRSVQTLAFVFPEMKQDRGHKVGRARSQWGAWSFSLSKHWGPNEDARMRGCEEDAPASTGKRSSAFGAVPSGRLWTDLSPYN